MLTLEQARESIIKAVRIAPETQTEILPLQDAFGRYLARTAVAQVDNPAFDNSAMDGYAIKIADLTPEKLNLPLQGESSCGSAPAVLAPGSCMRIFTGAPLPQGADAVVIQEDVKLSDGDVVFPHSVQPGQNIRSRGEDFRAGDALYQRGCRLHPYDLALLSAAGLSRVEVFRPARVLVVATGNELVAPGTALKPGQIYESNRLATLLQCQAMGMEVIDGGMVRDDPQALRALLEQAREYDFVITSGGVSVGDHDLVKQVFAEIGKIKFWKAKIKPGKPLAFGHVGERSHFFGLPGNPVSSLVTFMLFVQPALIAWHHGSAQAMELSAIAANDFRRHTGRTEFVRARLYTENGDLFATALKGQGSHMLGTLRHTNGFIKVEADSQGFAKGDSVVVLPLHAELA